MLPDADGSPCLGLCIIKTEDLMGSADGNQVFLEHLGWLQLLNWGAQWEK